MPSNRVFSTHDCLTSHIVSRNTNGTRNVLGALMPKNTINPTPNARKITPIRREPHTRSWTESFLCGTRIFRWQWPHVVHSPATAVALTDVPHDGHLIGAVPILDQPATCITGAII